MRILFFGASTARRQTQIPLYEVLCISLVQLFLFLCGGIPPPPLRYHRRWQQQVQCERCGQMQSDQRGLVPKINTENGKKERKKKLTSQYTSFFLFILIFFPFLFSIGLETLRDTRRSLRSGHFAAKFLIRKTTHH